MSETENIEEILTPRQLAFCQEYIIDLNGTQAAIRAGYSKKTAQEQSSRLLSNVKVSEYIEQLKKERSERTKVTSDRVIAELAKVAFADMSDIVDENGNLKPISEIKDTAIISKVSKVITKNSTNLSYQLHSKIEALKLLSQHLGILNEKVDVTVEHKGYDFKLDSQVKIVPITKHEERRTG